MVNRRLTDNDLNLFRYAAVRAVLSTLCAGLIACAAACSSPVGDADTTGATDDDAADDTSVNPADGNGDATSDGVDATGDASGDVAGDVTGGDVGDGAVGPLKGCLDDTDCNELVITSCQTAKCDLKSGLCTVVNLADDVTCPDLTDDKCKVNPVCKAGKCDYKLLNCDDGNPCTDDGCAAGAGCTNPVGKPSLCVDGNPCTLQAKCVGGECAAQTQINCDDKEPCTDDACDPKIGCTHTPQADATSCSDGLICTEGDTCKAGKCGGAPKVCADDGNPCTLAACSEKTGGSCTNAPLPAGILCDDGKPCTAQDQCDAGGVCVGQTDSCDDKNPCTDDSCDPTTGCVHAANTKPCPAPDACSTAGTCADKVCVTTPKTCADANACTDDSCDKLLGCQYKPNVAACFDGSICTAEDTCAAGVCAPGKAADCSDANPCTTDACDPVLGCNHPLLPYKSDCAAGKQCVIGMCLTNADACGDGWCAVAEDATTCPQDCPEAGGACQPNDQTCMPNCVASKCSVQSATCKASQGCQDLGGCLIGCADDVACQLGCVVNAGLPALEAYMAFDRCVQAFCIQDYWIGKPCAGGGQAYVTCVDACESTMCKLLSLQCKVSAGCLKVRACLQACPIGDPGTLACVLDCKTKGSDQDFLINGDLDACSAKYCQ